MIDDVGMPSLLALLFPSVTSDPSPGGGGGSFQSAGGSSITVPPLLPPQPTGPRPAAHPHYTGRPGYSEYDGRGRGTGPSLPPVPAPLPRPESECGGGWGRGLPGGSREMCIGALMFPPGFTQCAHKFEKRQEQHIFM